MKVIFISEDIDIAKNLEKICNELEFSFNFMNQSNDPLDVMSSVCTISPSLIIIDDDFVQPETAHILNSIRKVYPKISIIFLTSNNSHELGREISQIGIQYYGIKPLSKKELIETIESITKHKINSLKI